MMRSLLFSGLAGLLFSLLPQAAGGDGKGAPITPQVIGGNNTEIGEYPWMAALVESGEPDLFFAQFCGGSLIHQWWVVTAAHCVEDLEPSDLDVIMGLRDLVNDSGWERIPVTEIVIHPDFDSGTFENDIAMLQLSRRAGGYELLPVIENPALAAPGVDATAIGWGVTDFEDESEFAEILQEVEVPIKSMADLLHEESWGDGEIDIDIMLPAGKNVPPRKDTCAGDSGGPLVVAGSGGQDWVLAGITSFGHPDGCALPRLYGIYTRVSAFQPWIHSIEQPYLAAWEVENDVTADFNDDDGDGLPNFLEYAIGSDPNEVVTREFPTVGMVEIDDVRYPAITYRNRIRGKEVVYRVEEASSADFSNPVTFSQEQNLVDSQVLNDGTFELLTVRGNTALTDDTQSFLRLRVRESTRIVPAPRSVGFPDLAITSLINLDFTDPLRSDDRYYIKEYVLEPQDVGRVIHFTLRSDDFDAFLQLIDADTGALLESDDNGGGGLDSEIVLTVAAGVNYLFRVSSSIPEELGEFSLASFRVIVLTPLGLPETVNTNFNTLDDTDPLFPRDTFYKDDFVLTGVAPGTAIKITQTSPDWGDVDPFLTIINGETNQVLFREDDSGVGFDATLSFVVKPNTTYHVRASTAIADQVGVYTLKTVFAPTISKDNITVNGALAASDETDPLFVDNDNPNDPFYKDDYLLIGAQAGDMVTVEYTSTSIDPFLAIINAEDGLLALADELCAGISCIDDIGEANLNARLTFEVQDGVTYLIRASSASVEETGAYAIRAFISP